MKVIVLVGGISRKSLNKRLFAEVEKLAGDFFEFTVFDISTLPFFSQDDENTPPQSVVDLKKLATESDAVLIVTPEYNRSIPGVLKNALDWGSRPPSQNVWTDKSAAIMGASTGAIGTFGAQQHLRSICANLDLHVMDQPVFYFDASVNMDANGLKEHAVGFVTHFLSSFEEWIKVIRG